MASLPPRYRPSGLISFFVHHPVACNIVMVLMVLFGIYGLMNMSTQFFPDTTRPSINISTTWRGASAADIEDGILKAMEPELRFLDGVEEMESYAREGTGNIVLTFDDRADIQAALSDVEQALRNITTLPQDAESPRISQPTRYESVARLMISGPYSEEAMQHWARQIRDALLARGISRVSFEGFRSEEILVEISEANLRRLGLTIQDVGDRISAQTRNLPSGTLEGGFDRQIRATGDMIEPEEYRLIELQSLPTGEKIYLADVASINRAFDENAGQTLVSGDAAILLNIQRALTADMLESAAILDAYLEEVEGTLPVTLNLVKYEAASDNLVDRIMLLVNNGLSGLVLVLIVLFLFLNFRVAFWVAMGIPIAMLATMGVLFFLGQSINMMSLFALIMVLGIVVDDAIVVGENTATRLAKGDAPYEAAVNGASAMLWPVIAASATTVAAFLPLLFVRDTIGQFMAVLPMVVIAVLIASIVECFVVLPGHLRHGADMKKQSRFRRGFDKGFAHFRENMFGPLVALAYRFRYATVAFCVVAMMVAVTAFTSGHLRFSFFPSPEAERVTASLTLAPGTALEDTKSAVLQIEAALDEALLPHGGRDGLVRSAIATLGQSGRNRGNEFAELRVALTASEDRALTTDEIADLWREAVGEIPGVERLLIMAPRGGGPAGRDIDIRFSGGELETLKLAALDMTERLEEYPGVTSASDNLPYGRPELLLQMTPRGTALGFNIESVGRQVRNALQGLNARTFPRGDTEITVRVRQENRVEGLSGLNALSVRAPSGDYVPLSEVVSITERAAFSTIQRVGGQRQVSVTANVDEAIITSQELTAVLADGPVAEVAERYNLQWSFSGRAEERAKAFADLAMGTAIALSLIYLILAWIFASWFKPFIVMIIIPFGVVGAFLGHYLMDFNITIMSLMGLLGLAGILVNNSIILMNRIDVRREDGQEVMEAAIGGAKDRLRAVILTSLTTIGGLTPLMFETSRQAQFMLPMAITIVFGLGVATLFVLFLVPSVVGIGADIKDSFKRIYGRREKTLPAE